MKHTLTLLTALLLAPLAALNDDNKPAPIEANPLDSIQWTENGSPFSWRIRTIKYVLLKEDGTAEFNGTFESAKKTTQGLALSMGSAAQSLLQLNGKDIVMKLNGKEIAPLVETVSEKIFSLPISSGSNKLTLTFSDSDGKKPYIQLTPVDLNYVMPNTKLQLAALRRSIEYLGSRYTNYPAKQFLQSLSKLNPDTNGIMEQIRALRLEALVRNNPVFDFDSLLVRRTKNASFPVNFLANISISKDKYDNEIDVLTLKNLKLATVYRPENGSAYVGEICLHFDAKKMLLSSINTKENTWQVFELNTDGSGLRPTWNNTIKCQNRQRS